VAFAEPWAAASGKHGFDPMMERAVIARAWDSWMTTAPLVLPRRRRGGPGTPHAHQPIARTKTTDKPPGTLTAYRGRINESGH
jgi:hypothetical protein